MEKPQKPNNLGAKCLFAMGLPFVVLNIVSVLMFKGMGIRDGQITFWTS